MGNDLDQAVIALAAALGESEPEPIATLRMLLNVKGVRFAQHILTKAHETQATGGMLTADKSRQRTLGGTFFALARRRCTPEEQAKIWPGHTILRPRVRGGKDNVNEQPTVAWADRKASYTTALKAPGKGRTMKVTLVGRPGRIVHHGPYILTVMHDNSQPDLPRGLPPMPAAPRKYAVLIGRKQWDRVAAALQANQDDQLIIEGHAAYDEQLPGIVVYTLRAVTKQQQIAERTATQNTRSA